MKYQRMLVLVVFLAIISIIFLIAVQLRLILVPFVLAYIFQFALRPLVNMLKQKGVGHGTAVATVFFTSFLIVGSLLYILIPAIISELSNIQNNIENYSSVLINKYHMMQEVLLGGTGPLSEFFGEKNIVSGITESFESNIMFFIQKIPQKIIGILPMVLYVIVIPFATFFFLLDAQRIKERLIAMIPNRYFEISLNLLNSLHKQFGLILKGMLTSALIISILASAGLWFIGLEYPILVGIFSGIANLIPYFGPITGTITASLVAIVTGANPIFFLYILLVFLCVNLVDNVLVQPLVLARAAKLHPLAVIFLVLTGSKIGGIFGMLLAVPLASLLQVVVIILFQEFKKPIRPPFKDFIESPPPGETAETA
ncbi:AI-2E family transporter [Candidatus Latescibacterota bacterium]